MTDHRPSTHRVLVPTLLVLATLIAFVGAFAVWVNRQALNTDNWSNTSGKLLADKKVQDALGNYLVDQLFTNVNVAQAIQAQLPPVAQPLAGPVAAGLEQLAHRAAPQLLARPKVQDAWVVANVAAHRQLLAVINGGSGALSTTNGNVVLNIHVLVDELAKSLGVSKQVAAARSKLQGSTGAQARALAQSKLGVTLPPSSGQLVVMRSTNLRTAQDVAGAVKGLAIVLPAIALLMFALAVYLARGRRRPTLRTTGWCFVLIGVLLLLVRRVGGDQVVNALVKVPSNKPAVHDIWDIATSLLKALSVAMIVYGLVIVAAAWLGGETRAARWVRRALAPTLREQPGLAYGAVGVVLLMVVAWGPTPALRNIWTILLFAALLALGVYMLRRETAVEFPAVAVATAGGPGGSGSRLDEIERLATLHDRGDLTDEEFAAEKVQLVGGPSG
jgi:hypothetical protein